MMKRKILLILNMAIIGFSTAACSDDETNYITPEKKYPLTAFAVAVNLSLIHIFMAAVVPVITSE